MLNTVGKKFLKRIIPGRIIRMITGLFYGWHGNYPGWEEASNRCSGYNSATILRRVQESVAKVRDGEAVYERDSVLFDHVEYSYPLLAGLMWIAANNNGKLNIIDYGGSLGSTYYQNRKFLDPLPEVNWCIVEQTDFVSAGQKYFSNEKLHFFNTIDDCLSSFPVKAVLLSSVLPYIEKPYELLENIRRENIEYIIIDRTPFVTGDDRITIQKVNPRIYKADYPCRFFNKEKFLFFFKPDYELIIEFDALDRANIPSEFKGFIFRKKQS